MTLIFALAEPIRAGAVIADCKPEQVAARGQFDLIHARDARSQSLFVNLRSHGTLHCITSEDHGLAGFGVGLDRALDVSMLQSVISVLNLEGLCVYGVVNDDLVLGLL